MDKEKQVGIHRKFIAGALVMFVLAIAAPPLLATFKVGAGTANMITGTAEGLTAVGLIKDGKEK